MRVVNISQFENSVVIHFDTEDNRIITPATKLINYTA